MEYLDVLHARRVDEGVAHGLEDDEEVDEPAHAEDGDRVEGLVRHHAVGADEHEAHHGGHPAQQVRAQDAQRRHDGLAVLRALR